MAPKDAGVPFGEHSVYLVVIATLVASVHATLELAEAAKEKIKGYRVEIHKLNGGSIIPEDGEKKPIVETKVAPQTPKKRPVNDEDLHEDVQELLGGRGTALKDMAIFVIGILPTIGRANAEKLILLYGGRISKNLSKRTSLVIIGDNVDPAKLQKIQELGVKSVGEDGLVALIERGILDEDDLEDDEDEDMEDVVEEVVEEEVVEEGGDEEKDEEEPKEEPKDEPEPKRRRI